MDDLSLNQATECLDITKPLVVVDNRLRNEKGQFLPKRPLEFTLGHFLLEISEVTIAILLAQAIWEGGAWLIK